MGEVAPLGDGEGYEKSRNCIKKYILCACPLTAPREPQTMLRII